MPTTDTKVRLLRETYRLMLSQGYAATSVDQICEAAGVSKGSFYHFFKSKQQVALDMLRDHMDGAQQDIEKGLDLDGAEGADVAIRYVRHLEETCEEVWRDGCLIGTFALELAETNPELRQEISSMLKETASHFEEIFHSLGKPRGHSTGPSARELAEQLLVVIEGGVVLSRAHGDTRFLSQAIRLFRGQLESILEGS